MFRPAARALVRAPAIAARPPPTARRLISSAAPKKSRSWKNYAVRLGLAAGAVYYYNTSSVFAQEPSFSLRPQPRQPTDDESSLSTLDSITPKIRQEKAAAQPQQQPNSPAPEPAALEGGLNPQDLEDEADQESAFNPETGEINWDCPCLGGMAHGPCGEEFKAAFSCFVYSQEEPKGIDCIEKFKAMQDCFRQHPDVYGAELEDDDEEVAEGAAVAGGDAGAGAAPSQQTTPAVERDALSHPDEKRTRAKDVHSQVKAAAAEEGEHSESDALFPKVWHDTEDKNESAKKTEK